MQVSDASTHRAYVFVGKRKVHYRRWGNGPVVLMLHGSPQSSCAMEPLAQFFASQGFCAIAPDTPGNGLSDPLKTCQANNAQNDISDYAKALIEFANALTIKRFSVFGFHTGATIATTCSVMFPERISALLCDGIPAWTESEREELLSHYAPAFDLKWDGSHLCWLWARMEQQQLFFPWYNTSPETRMDFNLSPATAVNINVMDWLEAGENYRDAYQAAFAFKTSTWVKDIKAPHLFASMQQDPLSEHLSRDILAHCNTQVFTDHKIMWQTFSDFLNKHHGESVTQLSPKKPEVEILSGWVGEQNKALAWQGNIEKQSELSPLVLLHDAGGSKAAFNELLPVLAQNRKVIALDLPGHGDSDRRSSNDICDNIESLGLEIAIACKQLGLNNYTVIGRDLGGQIAAWMVKQQHAKQGAVISLKQIPEEHRTNWQQRYATDLSPQWDGTHLIRAFRIARWESLYYPWFERTRDNALLPYGDIEPEKTHQRAVNLLKANQSWQAAVKIEADFDWLKYQNLNSRFYFFTSNKDHFTITPHLLSQIAQLN